MPINAIHGIDQLALPEARLVQRYIFNDLHPLKTARPP
jgi:hypothetical protein